MKMLEITDEVYSALAERVMVSNKTLTDVLRSLLGIDGPEPPPIVGSVANAPDPDGPLLAFINSPEFKMETSGIGKYLLIFGWIKKNEPHRFHAIENYQRGKRVYFSQNPKQIQESGKGVSVKRIPGTDYYAMVTMDHPTKRRVIKDLLLAMGYSRGNCSKIADTIEDSGITRSHLRNLPLGY
jgi:negative regulator of replication initiation